MFKMKLKHVVLFVVCSLPFGVIANAGEHKKAAAGIVETVKPQIIELEAKLVDGKKSWMPSAVSAHPGKIIFRLKNSFPDPHGFNIANVLSAPVVVQGNATLDVPTEIKAAGVYDLSCQLHPAHVKAVLTIK